ncbi:MAG: RNA 3'-terminal phosphate cyclase [Verrucomicrobia bacterium]|nr:MAG: RNA 3'-terminal phosphate cyclase [Verrucomicrobiota bacterium]
MITIDGSQGEGGGQILRTSLALSLVTDQSFRMERIRARRQKPGLLKQHLTAVEAAKTVGCAEVTGAALGSQDLEFKPGPVTPGNYRFAVRTAGSATLVLQTVLPALLSSPGPSTLTLEGGTHNPMAPPFDFLAKSFMPLIQRMGPVVELQLKRPGFYPAGGGQFHARVQPVPNLSRLDLLERGAIRSRRAKVISSKLPEHVAERELAVLREKLKWKPDEYAIETVPYPLGPGNAVVLEVETEPVIGIFTGFGERGRPAEEVARSAIEALIAWMETNVPVDEHLADQLLIPMVLAGGGSFRTTKPSLHTTTNAEVIQRFIPTSILVEQENQLVWRITVGQAFYPAGEGGFLAARRPPR